MKLENKLRIAMFMSSNPTVLGGVQEHVEYLVKHLRQNGHVVHLYGSEPGSSRYSTFYPIGHTVEVPTLNGNWGNIHFLKPEIDRKKLFSRNKYDLLHIHEPYVPFAAWELIHQSDLPKIVTFHNAWDNDSMNNALSTILPLIKQTFSTHVSGAIFVSRIAKKRWETLCSRALVCKIIPNGIDESSFYPKKKGSGPVEFLFVGRLVQRKGIIYLMKSFRLLLEKNKNIHLSVIGAGAEEEWCKNYIKKYKLHSHITLLGQIGGKRKIPYYQQADIFCAPYSDEAFPITILEAISCGCTIVGFTNEAMKEMLASYPAKSLLVHKGIDTLSQAFETAAGQSNLRKKVALWAKKEIHKYHWSVITKKTEDAYLEMLSRIPLP